MASKIKVDTLETANGSGTIASSNPITVTGALTATTLVGNGAAVTNVPENGVGVGQTYQDLTASRATNTQYTNSTGKPIHTTIIATCGTNADIKMQIQGVNMPAGLFTNANNGRASLSNIVPAGHTYKIIIGGSPTLRVWMELR